MYIIKIVLIFLTAFFIISSLCFLLVSLYLIHKNLEYHGGDSNDHS